MSTPPSAQGITAQLPFVDDGPEGAASQTNISYSYSQLPPAPACTLPCQKCLSHVLLTCGYTLPAISADSFCMSVEEG